MPKTASLDECSQETPMKVGDKIVVEEKDVIIEAEVAAEIMLPADLCPFCHGEKKQNNGSSAYLSTDQNYGEGYDAIFAGKSKEVH